MVGIDAWGRTNEGAPRVDKAAEFAASFSSGFQYSTVLCTTVGAVLYSTTTVLQYCTVQSRQTAKCGTNLTPTRAVGVRWKNSDSHEGRET